MAKVAIVIVCMNNLKNLIPCLDSIKKYTKVECEVWVTAYLFSKENLSLVKEKYPEVHWVESNEIRGFAENNNLALRQVKTEYTLILNDDTEFKEPVLDELLASMAKTPDAAIMSPKLVNRDGSFQSCGRAPMDWIDFLKEDTFGYNNNKRKSKYINQQGIFQSYNISGACFLTKTAFFRNMEFFNEYYFFTPEDIAFSTKVNEKGYKCYVDADVKLYHYGGGSGTRKSMVKTATLPAARKGCVEFHGRKSKLVKAFLKIWITFFSLTKICLFVLKGNKVGRLAQWHCIQTMFIDRTPKEIFTKYYLQIKKS
mgnify:CR=1 FL=1